METVAISPKTSPPNFSYPSSTSVSVSSPPHVSDSGVTGVAWASELVLQGTQAFPCLMSCDGDGGIGQVPNAPQAFPDQAWAHTMSVFRGVHTTH